jgi:hypothetical protein
MTKEGKEGRWEREGFWWARCEKWFDLKLVVLV